MSAMPRKTAARTKTAAPDDAVFFTRLFGLVQKEGWVGLTLPRIARAVKMPVADIIKIYPDKHTMLTAFARFIDGKVAGVALEEGASLKERLFEVIMQRLDALGPFKPGLIRLLDDLQANPATLLALGLEAGCQLRRSVNLMLELAGTERVGLLAEPLHISMKFVYLQTLRTWKNDASADMGSTMAQLDKWLDRCMRLLRIQ